MQRGLVGEIIGRFERKGFVLKGLKLFQTPKELAQEHYKARARLARPTRPTRPTRTDIYFGGVPLPPLRLPAAATAAHAPCATGWRRAHRTGAARPRGARRARTRTAAGPELQAVLRRPGELHYLRPRCGHGTPPPPAPLRTSLSTRPFS